MRRGERQAGALTTWRRAAMVVMAGVLVTAGAVLLLRPPPGPRGPETVAENLIDALLRTPEDDARLRAAAHLGEADDPRALLNGLATRIALDFLRARARQGATQRVVVTQSRHAGAGRYVAVLRVVEQADEARVSNRYFEVTLQQAENGGWRIASVAAIE